MVGLQGTWNFPVLSPSLAERELILKDLRRVRGQVLRADGEPVREGRLTVVDPSAEVANSPFNPFSEGIDFDLAANGTFFIEGRHSAVVKAKLSFAGDDYLGRMDLPSLRLDQGPIVIRLPEFVPVTGHVWDEDGKPVAGAELQLKGSDDTPFWWGEAAEDGSFHVQVLLEPGLRIVALRGEQQSVEQPVTSAAAMLLVVPNAE